LANCHGRRVSPETLPKDISEKEDISFNPAIVAAVGRAMPTIWETIFQKSPKA
jgi:hypothetical protein